MGQSLFLVNATRFVQLLLVALCTPGLASGVEYSCRVKKKFDAARTYPPEQIEKWQFSIRIEENAGNTFVSRCSFSASAEKITCDRYRVDNEKGVGVIF